MGGFLDLSSRSDRLDISVKSECWSIGVGSAGVCRYPRWVQWNAASDNTGESREGVGVGSIERGAASGRCRWPECSRRARENDLIVLKEGVGVVVSRVWCVYVSALCLSPSEFLVSRSLPSWLARNGAGERLTDGNNVQ
jgi:hypothetical protein